MRQNGSGRLTKGRRGGEPSRNMLYQTTWYMVLSSRRRGVGRATDLASGSAVTLLGVFRQGIPSRILGIVSAGALADGAGGAGEQRAEPGTGGHGKSLPGRVGPRCHARA